VKSRLDEVAEAGQAMSAAATMLVRWHVLPGGRKHSGTAGEQRELAAVIYHTGKQRFGGRSNTMAKRSIR
jgi:hypothetical protein